MLVVVDSVPGVIAILLAVWVCQACVERVDIVDFLRELHLVRLRRGVNEDRACVGLVGVVEVLGGRVSTSSALRSRLFWASKAWASMRVFTLRSSWEVICRRCVSGSKEGCLPWLWS